MTWYTDRSRIVTGLQHCAMARYFRYHVRGLGVSSPGSYDQAFGLAIHKGLELLLQGGDPVSVSVRARTEFVKWYPLDDETSVLVGSMIHAWDKFVKPKLLEEFDIVSIEPEMVVELEHGIKFMFRPDLIVRHKQDGKLYLIDYKTIKAFYSDTVDRYRRDIQMSVYCAFASIALGEKVEGYYVQFLVKGQRKATYNVEEKAYSGPETSDSKLAYCYHREADPPITDEDWSPVFMIKAGNRRKKIGDAYKRKLITEAGLTPPEWVEKLRQEDVYDIFPLVGPYPSPSASEANMYIRMVVGEELRWKKRLESVAKDPGQVDYIIPRSFDCYKWGRACEFLEVCFGEKDISRMPVREPHHEAEKKSA